MPTKSKKRSYVFQDLGIALSSANLMFFKQWSDLTLSSTQSPHTDWSYEVISATTASYLGLLTVIAVLTAFFFALVTLARKSKSRNLTVAAHLLMATSFLAMFNGLRIAYGLGMYLADLGYYRYPLYAVAAFSGIYLFFRKNHFLVDAYRTVATILLPFVLVTATHALRGYRNTATVKSSLQTIARNIPTESTIRHDSRVIVNLFDELDYTRITHPDVAKELPELARWKEQALFAHNARPPGKSTAYSIPSFFLGEKITEPLFLRDNRLSYGVLTPDGKTEYKKWREQINLVLDLRRRGYKVAVIGWYLPYCRMFLHSADRCERFSHYSFLKESYSDSYGQSISNILREVVQIRPSRQKAHLNTYEGILAASEQVLKDPSYDFVFIHWPIPHAPWIYSREEKRFSSHNAKGPSGYFDNLLGVDVTMKQEREWLNQSGQWDNANIIMLSDHGWNSSAEFDGHWDVRTPFLLKLSQQTKSVDYYRPFNTVILKDLVSELLQNKLTDSQELVGWLNERTEAESADPAS